MVLIDTSVWITHFQENSKQLEQLLVKGEVVSHPFIIGELACGNLKNWKEILSLLKALPEGPFLDEDEFLYFVEKNNLPGQGIGFVDIHILASAFIAGIPLWTYDKKLHKVASDFNISFK